MQVTVHLDPPVANEIRSGTSESPTTKELLSVVKNLGMELHAVHPNALNPGLATTFSLEAQDAEHAATAVLQLQASGFRAYMNPPPAMP